MMKKIFAVLVLSTSINLFAQHKPVSFVDETNRIYGSGFVVKGVSSCYVITAQHVTAGELKRTIEIGDNHGKYIADKSFDKIIENKVDVALYNIDKRWDNCSESYLLKMDEVKKSLDLLDGYLMTRSGAGEIIKKKIIIKNLNKETIFFESSVDGVHDGDSGSALIVNGVPVGVYNGVSIKNKLHYASRIDYIVDTYNRFAELLGLKINTKSGDYRDPRDLYRSYEINFVNQENKRTGFKLNLNLRDYFIVIHPGLFEYRRQNSFQEYFEKILINKYGVPVNNLKIDESDYNTIIDRMFSIGLIERELSTSSDGSGPWTWLIQSKYGIELMKLIDGEKEVDYENKLNQIRLLLAENNDLKRKIDSLEKEYSLLGAENKKILSSLVKNNGNENNFMDVSLNKVYKTNSQKTIGVSGIYEDINNNTYVSGNYSEISFRLSVGSYVVSRNCKLILMEINKPNKITRFNEECSDER